MTCPICQSPLGSGECAECRALADEMRANADALSALRYDEFPPLVVRIRRSGQGFSWLAAAAAVLLAIALQSPQWPLRVIPSVTSLVAAAPRVLESSAGPEEIQPLKIKILTPDSQEVVYWLIDSRSEEQR